MDARATGGPSGDVSASLVPHAFLHFAALVAVQAAYAWAYTRSPYLRGAVVVPLAYRLLVWTLPVVLLLLVDGRQPLRALRLWPGISRGVAWGTAAGAAILALNVAGHSLLAGSLTWNLGLGPGRWVNGVALVGFSEEVVFRGWYLPALAQRYGFARGNALQALLFLLVHFPGWLLLGQFFGPAILQLIVTIWLFGLFTGWLLRRTQSLWACMVVHSFNNLASFVVQ